MDAASLTGTELRVTVESEIKRTANAGTQAEAGAGRVGGIRVQ